MTEENTDQFLTRRERELMSRAAALRGQLAPIEAELAKVQRMRAVLAEETTPPPSALTRVRASQTLAGRAYVEVSSPSEVDTWYATRTIKDLAIQALIDGYPHGATASELRDFMRVGYSRTVDPGSLRTQLHRLKAAGILGQEPSNDTWNFQDGKRALYRRYDHPTSRQGMSELQDEPTEPENIENNEFLQRATELAWRETTPTPEEIAAAERLEEIRLHRVATSGEAASSTSNNEIIHDGGKLKLNP
jgi:hypothetical protein